MPDVAIPKGFRYAILAPTFKRGLSKISDF